MVFTLIPPYLHTPIPPYLLKCATSWIRLQTLQCMIISYPQLQIAKRWHKCNVQGKTTDHRLRSRLWWRSASTSSPTLIVSRWRAYSGDFTLDKDNKKTKRKTKTLKNKDKEFLPTFNKWSWQIKNRRSANAAVVRELQTKIDQGENVDFEIQVRVPNQWHHHHHHNFFLKLKSLFGRFSLNQWPDITVIISSYAIYHYRMCTLPRCFWKPSSGSFPTPFSLIRFLLFFC